MLNGFQKKVSGAAIACLSICVIAAFVVLIFMLLGKFLSVFGPVVLPVIVALIASFIVSPIVNFISVKLRVGRTWACILAFAIILAALSAAIAFALPALAGEIAQMFAAIPEAFHNVALHLTEKFPNAKIIVVVDDIDLPKGVVRFRERGKSGTHNGLRSIVSYIGEEFERVRIGIGRDERKDLADYVLSNIRSNEQEIFDQALDKVCEILKERIFDFK